MPQYLDSYSCFWESPLSLSLSLSLSAVLVGHAIFKLTYLSNHDYKALYFESDAATVNEIVLKVRAGSPPPPSPSPQPTALLKYASIPHTQDRILHQITFRNLFYFFNFACVLAHSLCEVDWLH